MYEIICQESDKRQHELGSNIPLVIAVVTHKVYTW